MKTTKLLISRNEDVIAIEKQKAVESVALLQIVINEAKVAELEITNENFGTACKDPERFAKAEYLKTIEIVPSLNNRRMTKEAVLNSYEFPDTTKFVAAANIFTAQTNGVQKQLFQIVEGQAGINEDELNIFIDKYSYYATHHKSIELHGAYEAMLESMNKVDTILKANFGESITTNNLNRFLVYEDGFKLRIPVYLGMIQKFN